MNDPVLADRELLLAWVQQQDQRAFAELVRRHLSLVLATCQRRLGAADADDAAQATFLVLARRASVLVRDSRPLAGWLHTVAGRMAGNVERQRRRRQQHEREAAMAVANATGSMLSATEVDADRAWADASPHLDACLDELPAHERDALVLHYLAGKDRGTCAVELGIGVEALKKRLQRGLDRLRVGLRRRGVTVAAGLLVTALEGHGSAGEAPATLIHTTTAGSVLGNASPAVTTLAATATGGGMSAAVIGACVLGAMTLAGIATMVWASWSAESPRPTSGTISTPIRSEAMHFTWDDAHLPAWWEVSLLDWTFTPDAGQDPGLVPLRLVEVLLIRSTVQPGDALRLQAVAGWKWDHDEEYVLISGDSMLATVEAGWRISQKFHNDSTRLGLLDEVVLSPRTETAFGLDPSRTIARTHFGMRLAWLGCPDLVWPLPTRPLAPGDHEQFSTGTIVSRPRTDDPIPPGNMILDYAWQDRERTGRELGTMKGSHLGLDFETGISGSVKGSLRARQGLVRTADGTVQPAWASMHADLRLIVDLSLIKPTRGVEHRITGRLQLARHAWRLEGVEACTWPADVRTLTAAVAKQTRIDGTNRSWKELAATSDRHMARAARGVLLSAEHVPVITPIPPAPAIPPAAKPVEDF